MINPIIFRDSFNFNNNFDFVVDTNLPEKKAFKPKFETRISTQKIQNKQIKEINDKVSQDLIKIIHSLKDEIYVGFETLENVSDLVDSSLNLEEALREYPEISLNIAGCGTELLSLILPESLLNLDYFESGVDAIGKIANYGGLFLAATTNGVQLTAVFYKGKMLQESRQLLNECCAQLDKKRQDLSPEKIEQAENILKKWKVDLNTLDENLKGEKKEAGISTVFTSLYVFLEIKTIIALKFLPHSLSTVFSSLGLLGGLMIGLGQNAVDYFFHRSRLNELNDWKTAYEDWQKKSFKALPTDNLIVRNAEDLYKKRIEIIEKKRNLVRSSFEDTPSREELLASYVDHQETIELILQRSLKELIRHKHHLEKKILSFNFSKAKLDLIISLASLIIAAGLSVLLISSLAVSGIGLLLLIATLVPTIFTLTLIFFGFLYTMKLKPNTTKALTSTLSIKIAWDRVNKAICTYRHKAKVKKLQEAALALYPLHFSEIKKTEHVYIKALKKFEKAQATFERSKNNHRKWKERIKKHEGELFVKGWQDLAKHASLANFDSLEAFNFALKECDPRLLSKETKYLLETQLGINLEALQKKLVKDPKAVQTALSRFAASRTNQFLNFINSQQVYLQEGFIPAN